MLCELTIENIAVISQATIQFGGGFNAFTGETGAGKSILLGAIGAILGERTSRDLIRTGESKAFVSALFSNISATVVQTAASCGIECEAGGELLLTREITQEHNSCRINGRAATVSMLKEIGQLLINTHGQQDNQMLANIENHRRFVDGFGDLGALLADYQAEYAQLTALDRKLKKLSAAAGEKEQQMALLRQQIDEIEAASLTDGEEEELTERRKLIKNAENLTQLLTACRDSLYGTDDFDGALSLVEQAAEALTDGQEFVRALAPAAARLENARYELEDILEQVREQLFSLEFDAGELDEIEERLDVIHRLKRKYGADVAAVLAHLEQAQQALFAIEDSDYALSQLSKERAVCFEAVTKKAQMLTQARKKASERFVKAVSAELKSLDMPSVVLTVALEPAALSQSGGDTVEFLLSVNPGEAPRPLSKTASGGEMSRIMLAIKNVVSQNDDVATLIFDEIDTGVSGRAAQKVGAKLCEVATARQVICVTHLAQVAAFADTHFVIEKNVHEGRTFTHVSPLDTEGRAREIARITSGEPITDLALENARQLLASAAR